MICDVRMHNLRALYSFYRKERNSAALSMGRTFGSCKIASKDVYASNCAL